MLTHYYKQPAVPFAKTRDETLALAPQLVPMVADVAERIHAMRERGESLLFEGAQGALLDIDHGTYPFVTSSNCLAGAAAPGSGIGPQLLDYVLGIVKAYTTRVGGGPFPTELTDDVGAGLAKRGNEFGSVTGRPRRCGWLDIPMLRRSFELNGVDGACIMKLDVLDGMPEIRICTHYRVDGQRVDRIPTGADAVAKCEPVYETMPGWSESTVGARSFDALPANARAYLRRIEALTGTPIAMVSTGPDRDDTIVLRIRFSRSSVAPGEGGGQCRPTHRAHEPPRQLGAVQHARRAAGADRPRSGLRVQPDHLHRPRRPARRRRAVADLREAARDPVDALVRGGRRHGARRAGHRRAHDDDLAATWRSRAARRRHGRLRAIRSRRSCRRCRSASRTSREMKTAVLWWKACSVYKPDFHVDYLPDNPWIHQPFEVYDNLRPEQLRARLFAQER